jgi:SAM-dependent methyltransferase
LVPLIPREIREGIRRGIGRPTPQMTPREPFESKWNLPLEIWLDPHRQEQPHNERSQELVVEYLRRALRYTEGRISLLDAPCGNGRLYRGLEREGLLDRIDYAGLDLTPNLVEAARRLMPAHEITMGSVESMPFPDASFDVIVAQHILRHLESYEQAIREYLRVGRWMVVIVEKAAAEKKDEKGTGYSEGEGHFWTNSWDPVRIKHFARANGASIGFTLNDARRDDPDGQFIYVFYK